jgi:hypothetical protein
MDLPTDTAVVYVYIKCVPNSKIITSPLQSRTKLCCLGKYLCFARTIGSTQKHSLDRMHSFSALK